MLLSHSPDVVGFKPTTASDVADTKFKSLSSPLSSFPTRDLPGFDAEGKLRDLNPTKAASIRHGVSSKASKATFIVFNTSRQMNGSKRQLTPTRSTTALAILTAHSPTPTPDSSPTGPMHIVAATGMPYSRATSMAHSISKMLRKYSQMIRSTLFRMSTSRAFLSSVWTLDLTEEPGLKVLVCVIPPATMVPRSRATFLAVSHAAWLISAHVNLQPLGRASSWAQKVKVWVMSAPALPSLCDS